MIAVPQQSKSVASGVYMREQGSIFCCWADLKFSYSCSSSSISFAVAKRLINLESPSTSGLRIRVC